MSAMFDDQLLDLARLVLDGAGFVTERLEISVGETSAGEERSLLLAQDAFFVLVVGAVPTVADLRALEPAAVLELTERAAASELGAKQWDLYLVLLVEQPAADDGQASSQLLEINYNTRSI